MPYIYPINPHSMKFKHFIWPILILPVAILLSASQAPSVREIMTSQHLFIVQLEPLAKGKSQKARRKFKAELRDSFKVIRYEGDSSYLELDWTMCPDGKCPEVGQFDEGTVSYIAIDSLIRSCTKKKPSSNRSFKKQPWAKT